MRKERQLKQFEVVVIEDPRFKAVQNGIVSLHTGNIVIFNYVDKFGFCTRITNRNKVSPVGVQAAPRRKMAA